MKQMKLVLLVVSTLRLATPVSALLKTSDGLCWLTELEEQTNAVSFCCLMNSISPWADTDTGELLFPERLITGSMCHTPGAIAEGNCEDSEKKTLTAQGWTDLCRAEGKEICAYMRQYAYECEAPVPDPLPSRVDDPTVLPTPPEPGSAFVLMQPLDPETMCVPGQNYDLCGGASCAPYGSCEDALVALSEVASDESSNDPGSPDEVFSCSHYRDTVLASACPQCVDPACVDPARLFSEGPPAGARPFWRGAGGTTAALALAGVATAAVLFGAAVLRKRRGVRALAGEPLTAGADSGEASDAVEGPQ